MCGYELVSKFVCVSVSVQPIADRVARNLEIIFKTLSTYQNSAHGIYDEYKLITWYYL